MTLSPLDVLVFVAYFVGVVVFAVTIAARSKTRGSSSDFFLASNKLPWYAVGASFIASNISTEHFIGMVGWGFLYGMAVAQWEWGNFITFSLLIWVFLPFYMRGNVATMPEFLERRYNRVCRYFYAAVMIVGLVVAMLGGVMYAGAKAMNVFFPSVHPALAVLILAVAAGTYTVYGGLLSAVWADVLQYCLLMVGGLVVTLFGLYHCEGLGTLAAELPERFIIFYPATHEMIPWTGLVFGVFSVGIWYSCANQFMVQRCLGARSEWDARMGIVMAGFSKALLPFLVVVPGIIAFYLFQDRISDGDQAWPFMVKLWLPAGLAGLVLAGLASAIMSTLSAITNSSATIFTLDLYKSILRPKASDHELHLVARLSAAAAMAIGAAIALYLVFNTGASVFGLIQQVFFYMAPPIASIFLVGILWRGATPAAATATLFCGFGVFLPLAKFVLFPRIEVLRPYDNFMHHTFATFLMSTVLLLVLSLFTRRKTDEELKGVIWTRSAFGFLESEKERNRGPRNLTFWWALMVIVIVSCYAVTQHYGSGTVLAEAEEVPHETSGTGTVLVQTRAELAVAERFNLWTGGGQVLFSPSAAGEALTFEVPIPETGVYRMAVMLTAGADYGRISVRVDGRPTEISLVKTTIENAGGRCRVEHVTLAIFDAGSHDKDDADNLAYSIAGQHIVRRVGLGEMRLTAPVTRVVFRSLDGGRIGVDQFILHAVKP